MQVDDWIEVRIAELHAVFIMRLQNEIENLLRLKVENPKVDTKDRQNILTSAIKSIINNSA